MKYYELFKDGMPYELYKMTELERLKLDFIIEKGGIIKIKPIGLFKRLWRKARRDK
jgi:hypothetical protein